MTYPVAGVYVSLFLFNKAVVAIYLLYINYYNYSIGMFKIVMQSSGCPLQMKYFKNIELLCGQMRRRVSSSFFIAYIGLYCASLVVVRSVWSLGLTNAFMYCD